MFTGWFRKPQLESVAKLRAATGLPIVLCKRILERLDPETHSKVLEAMASQTGSNLFHDPIEDDPKLQPILKAADEAAEQELAAVRKGRGFCYRFWTTKKRILKGQYGIKWLSLQDMNPWTRFD